MKCPRCGEEKQLVPIRSIRFAPKYNPLQTWRCLVCKKSYWIPLKPMHPRKGSPMKYKLIDGVRVLEVPK